ncbi:hypothetical protein Ltuc_0657 [Legionella tucsonensis]|uniref:Uncharacterized protein n=1 Tax=Legionella tucsonensis TaxID=40335 RepID=A0A0W0ZUQ0_9GAMM|nr:hypothetical protein Ltuc_0657 [Legionella tucsonensis]
MALATLTIYKFINKADKEIDDDEFNIIYWIEYSYTDNLRTLIMQRRLIQIK